MKKAFIAMACALMVVSPFAMAKGKTSSAHHAKASSHKHTAKAHAHKHAPRTAAAKAPKSN